MSHREREREREGAREGAREGGSEPERERFSVEVEPERERALAWRWSQRSMEGELVECFFEQRRCVTEVFGRETVLARERTVWRCSGGGVE